MGRAGGLVAGEGRGGGIPAGPERVDADARRDGAGSSDRAAAGVAAAVWRGRLCGLPRGPRPVGTTREGCLMDDMLSYGYLFLLLMMMALSALGGGITSAP